MKITTFNPKIVTKDAELLIRLFSELGFEKRHELEVSDGHSITNYRMKDDSGNHVDITGLESTPCDLTTIRMNVDNFDEAYDLLAEKGFKQARDIIETRTNKTVMMVAPSGFVIDLCQHIKDQDTELKKMDLDDLESVAGGRDGMVLEGLIARDPRNDDKEYLNRITNKENGIVIARDPDPNFHTS